MESPGKLQELKLHWSPPPPPPEAPIAFLDAQGEVQLSWLPPPSPQIRILRDGQPLVELKSELSLFTDRPPPGWHRYALAALGPDFVSAPSAEVRLHVPP